MLALLLTLSLTWSSVQGECNKDIVETISSIWKGKAPEQILKAWVGTSTHVWMSPSLQRVQSPIPGNVAGNVSCYTTTLDTYKVTAVDTVSLTNGTKSTVDYYMVMERPGVITFIEDGWSDYHMYLVYFKNDVTGYYLCDTAVDEDADSPGVGVKVLNYDQKDEKQSGQIEEAKALLKKSIMDDGVDIPTKCNKK